MTAAEYDGSAAIDWDRVEAVATRTTPTGTYRTDSETVALLEDALTSAGSAIETATGAHVAIPPAEIHHRHHWIEANLPTLSAVTDRIYAARDDGGIEILNSTVTGLTLGLLSRRVMAQFDPKLFTGGKDARLYFVYPNLQTLSTVLEQPFERVLRWITVHEVTHAFEFQQAPWLIGHVESLIEEAAGDLATFSLESPAVEELQRTMTVVEGFSEALMDIAIDDVADLRSDLEIYRNQKRPLRWILEKLLGLAMKRQQYERGREFFEAVIRDRDVSMATTVWREPAALPTDEEFEAPHQWIERMEE